MIRFSDIVSPVLFFIMIYLRLKGVKIIIDVPTPRIIGLKELDLAVLNPFFCTFRKAMMCVMGAWVFYPANRIVQYANESWWFEWGLKEKTLKIGNGILIDDSIPLVKSTWPDDELRLIGVAQLANWHGYDRVIKALAEINKESLPYKLSFTIVGDGAERPALEALVKELDLNNQVFFTGMLNGEKLNQIFLDKHIGVASLGLYRKGLNEASDLKTREYVARGLSVIGVGSDPDFEVKSPYRFIVENDGSIYGLVNFLRDINTCTLLPPITLRKYALLKLSLDSKISRLINNL